MVETPCHASVNHINLHTIEFVSPPREYFTIHPCSFVVVKKPIMVFSTLLAAMIFRNSEDVWITSIIIFWVPLACEHYSDSVFRYIIPFLHCTANVHFRSARNKYPVSSAFHIFWFCIELGQVYNARNCFLVSGFNHWQLLHLIELGLLCIVPCTICTILLNQCKTWAEFS